MFWFLVIASALAWTLQTLLSYRQTRAFSSLFVALRRKGRVAMGKFRGGLVAGSIVMFVLDEDDRIAEGHRLGGVTVLARFKRLDLFDAQHMTAVNPAMAAPFGKPTVKAVANAVETYRIVMGGGEAPEPPTALARVLDKLPGVKPKQRTLPQPVPARARATATARRGAEPPARWRRRVPVD